MEFNKNDFKNDIIALFAKEKGGHIHKWLYTGHKRPDERSGSELWHNFVTTNKNYYIIREEIKIIPDMIKTLDKSYDTVVEFGIGEHLATTKKTLPILKSQQKLQKYYAIDISEEQIKTGFNIIKEHTDSFETIGIVDDFYNEINAVEGENRLGLCLGATISNQELRIGNPFPRDRIVNQLKTLGNTVKGNQRGNLVLSIDANPDLNGALNSYQHPSWVGMMTGVMYDIKGLLKPEGDFNPALWHYSPVIDRDSHVLHQAVSPSEDQNFAIDGHEFNIKRGEHFVVKNNFKYPMELFLDMAREAGLTPESSTATDRHYSVVLLNAQA